MGPSGGGLPQSPWSRNAPLGRNLANVEEYVRSHEITYPVAVDIDLVTWRRFDNWAWPAMYLVDKRGIIRLRQVGVGVEEMNALLLDRSSIGEAVVALGPVLT